MNNNKLLLMMCGVSLSKFDLKEVIRYSRIKISDLTDNIKDVFMICDNKIIYSSIFLNFYEERDIDKFANYKYFTTMTFEDIMI